MTPATYEFACVSWKACPTLTSQKVTTKSPNGGSHDLRAWAMIWNSAPRASIAPRLRYWQRCVLVKAAKSQPKKLAPYLDIFSRQFHSFAVEALLWVPLTRLIQLPC